MLLHCHVADKMHSVCENLTEFIIPCSSHEGFVICEGVSQEFLKAVSSSKGTCKFKFHSGQTIKPSCITSVMKSSTKTKDWAIAGSG